MRSFKEITNILSEGKNLSLRDLKKAFKSAEDIYDAAQAAWKTAEKAERAAESAFYNSSSPVYNNNDVFKAAKRAADVAYATFADVQSYYSKEIGRLS